MNRAIVFGAMVAVCALGPAATGQSNPWANTIVSYVPGSNATPGYTTAGVALGEPTRFTGVSGGFPGAVTPFNAAWEADEIVSRYDAVIAPTWPNGAALREVSGGWPIPARNEWEPPEDFDAATPRLNYIANLVGHPGLNVPCGFDPDGLPLCLQIVASPFDDQAALDFGMSYQRETDWHTRRPPYPWRA